MPYKLYNVDAAYGAYLRGFDLRVPLFTGMKLRRPFVGIVLEVNGQNTSTGAIKMTTIFRSKLLSFTNLSQQVKLGIRSGYVAAISYC